VLGRSEGLPYKGKLGSDWFIGPGSGGREGPLRHPAWLSMESVAQRNTIIQFDCNTIVLMHGRGSKRDLWKGGNTACPTAITILIVLLLTLSLELIIIFCL